MPFDVLYWSMCNNMRAIVSATVFTVSRVLVPCADDSRWALCAGPPPRPQQHCYRSWILRWELSTLCLDHIPRQCFRGSVSGERHFSFLVNHTVFVIRWFRPKENTLVYWVSFEFHLSFTSFEFYSWSTRAHFYTAAVFPECFPESWVLLELVDEKDTKFMSSTFQCEQRIQRRLTECIPNAPQQKKWSLFLHTSSLAFVIKVRQRCFKQSGGELPWLQSPPVGLASIDLDSAAPEWWNLVCLNVSECFHDFKAPARICRGSETFCQMAKALHSAHPWHLQCVANNFGSSTQNRAMFPKCTLLSSNLEHVHLSGQHICDSFRDIT